MGIRTPTHALDVTRNLRALEWAKAELVSDCAGLLRALVAGDEEAAIDCLADEVIVSYLLVRRFGRDFSDLDAKVRRRSEELAAQGHEIERWYGDLSALGQHVAAGTAKSRR